jgi:hypothetical protein
MIRRRRRDALQFPLSHWERVGVRGTFQIVLCPKAHGAIGRNDESMDNTKLM